MTKNVLTFSDTNEISGVICKKLVRYEDTRGWLMEFFRSDELAKDHFPAMGYLSSTLPNVTRGPHEHINQTDGFCFMGPGKFISVLWDNREDSSTFLHRMILNVGENNPTLVIVPPRVVHAYHCISSTQGTVINVPNRLYRGNGKKDPVDEIRHEDDSRSPFVVDIKKIISERTR